MRILPRDGPVAGADAGARAGVRLRGVHVPAQLQAGAAGAGEAVSLVCERIPLEILAEAKRLNARVRRGADYRLGDLRTRGARYLSRERRKALRAGKPWSVVEVWANQLIRESMRHTYFLRFLR